jgi:hypothetical protein
MQNEFSQFQIEYRWRVTPPARFGSSIRRARARPRGFLLPQDSAALHARCWTTHLPAAVAGADPRTVPERRIGL